jgi:hypothetical protein
MSDVQPQQPQTGAEALDRLTRFVTEQIREGADRETIVTRLMAGGIQPEIAAEIVDRVYSETGAEEEEFSFASLVPAMAGGGLGAVIGGVVWGMIAAGTGYEIGWVAWGIGWLTGVGVVTFARGRRGRPLQLVAVASAVLGIMIGKYFAFFSLLKEYVGQELGAEAVAELSMLSPGAIQLFGMSLTSLVTGFDLLWIFLAVGTAWGIPKVRGLEAKAA